MTILLYGESFMKAESKKDRFADITYYSKPEDGNPEEILIKKLISSANRAALYHFILADSMVFVHNLSAIFTYKFFAHTWFPIISGITIRAVYSNQWILVHLYSRVDRLSSGMPQPALGLLSPSIIYGSCINGNDDVCLDY